MQEVFPFERGFSMKLLHTSDWHIGRSLFEFSLLEDQRDIFEEICNIIRQQQVDALLVCGDLYDRSLPSAQAVELLDEIFTTLSSRLHLPILAISGNHDSARRISYGSRLFEQNGLYLAGGWSPELKKVTLHDEHGPVNFFLLPYFVPQQVRLGYQEPELNSATAAFQAILEHNRGQIDPSQRNVLLAHGFFMRQSHHADGQDEPDSPLCSGSETSVGASDLTDLSCAELFDYVALGHLHNPQRAGCDWMRYSGSPLKYSVDESNSRKSVTLVELGEKGSLHLSEIPLKPRRDLRVISGTMEELCDPALASDDYVFARIVSDGPVLGAMSRLREVYPHTLGLSLSEQAAPTLSTVPEDVAALPSAELFRRFYRQVQQQELDEEQSRLVSRILEESGRDSGEE